MISLSGGHHCSRLCGHSTTFFAQVFLLPRFCSFESFLFFSKRWWLLGLAMNDFWLLIGLFVSFNKFASFIESFLELIPSGLRSEMRPKWIWYIVFLSNEGSLPVFLHSLCVAMKTELVINLRIADGIRTLDISRALFINFAATSVLGKCFYLETLKTSTATR